MSKVVRQYIRSIHHIMELGEIHSETYNNAISIITMIEYLRENEYLSNFDFMVLEYVSEGYNFSEISRIESVDRKKVSDSFKQSCNKIAFRLGGHFTDHGFIEHFINKRLSGQKRKEAIEEFLGD